MAVLLRGGMLPQAYVSPADMRATRELLRRRSPLVRKRAELLPYVQQTNRQYNWPERGQALAYQTNRPGVAERLAAPAVHKSVAGDLALIAYDAQLRRALALTLVQTAKQHDANPLSLLQTVPGLGKSLRLVLLDELHASARFPRGQDVVSSCRLVTCAKESAGKRDGPAGTKSGNAALPWALSEAAVLCLRTNPGGQK
jgi:transposase